MFQILSITLASFLMGYNISVISGVILFLKENNLVLASDIELIVGSMVIGAILGLFIGGPLIDRVGRKSALMLANVLYGIGGIVFALAHGIELFVLGRILSGFGVGITTIVVPLILAEITDKGKRGKIVTVHQLMITIGILAGFLINCFIKEGEGWRSIFLLETLIAVFSFGCLFFLKHFNELKTVTSFSSRFEKKYTKPLMYGILVCTLQQVTGINGVIYYSSYFLIQDGFSGRDLALLTSVGLGAINVVMTIISLYVVDRLGRRPLLIGGSLGMALGLFLFVTIAPQIGLMLYVAAFAISLGPVTWIYIAEIYPEAIRGRMVAIASLFNWIFNGAIAFGLLSLASWITIHGVFLIFIFFCFVSAMIAYFYLPETKGKSFDEIQKFWE